MAAPATKQRSAIATNSSIKDIRLLRKRPVYAWVTVWPFIFLYSAVITLYLYPELVWDRAVYLVHMTYVDFFHAICIPILFFLHAFLALFTIWSVKFRANILFQELDVNHVAEATHVLVETHVHKGESAIEKLIPATPPDVYEGTTVQPPCFVFQQRKWKLDSATMTFVKPRFPTRHTFSYYIGWKGLLTAKHREVQKDVFGTNAMEVTIPEFTDVFVDHALAPFFVFQMFCVLLWCMDEYWYYSLFTGVMMVGMECTVVYQRLRNMRTLRDMAQVPVREVTVLRDGSETTIMTNELLPMDLLIVPSNTPCPVDAVIVHGTCVVNEATLTGESTPQLKEAVDDVDVELCMKKQARHLLFSGTEIILSNGTHGRDASGRGSALAVVIKTGFETKQGKLLRTILHSQGRVSENSGEAFGFIGALVVFALAASGYLLRRGLADPNRSRWKLFLSCTQIITSVVPPELPMELSLAVNQSLLALIRLRVFCTEPFRIPFAGKVDTCCFDKTGTLTTDEMLFSGVDMCDGKGVLNTLKTVPKVSTTVLTTCHSLVMLNDANATIAGDAMEKASIGALGYKLVDNETVTYEPPAKEPAAGTAAAAPATSTRSTKPTAPAKTSKILVRYPFLAALRRMSCVVSEQGEKYVVTKGSPESVGQLCAAMPAEAIQAAEAHAARGYRVIALAYRPLTVEEKVSKEVLMALKREDCEKNLTFAGLALFDCPLKKDARETIENLRGGSHRCVIITGDSVQTAISVGRDVTMLPCKRHLIAVATEGTISWIDAVTKEPVSLSKSEILKNTFVQTRKHTTPSELEWDLCVSAENLSPQEFNLLVEEYNEYIAVWARCAPTHKEDIVMDLKKKGHIVLMAGDGTNDVGALKQAHAGIAVLNSAAVNPERKDGAVVAATPQPHNEPDLDPEMKLPPNFTLSPIPPPIGDNAPFMDRVRHQMAVTRRRAEIMHVEKWNKSLKEAAAKRAASGSSAAAEPVPFTGPGANGAPTPTSDFLMESLFNAEEGDTGMVPVIKLGDASIAAPFTCRSKALMSVCDIVRLGRSTLVTTLQMYKILALNCLTSAYSMSVLHSDGVKLGEKQMIVAGLILSVCFMCMSRSQPLEKLCPQRPVTRVFHPYMVLSILLQFALHLFSMIKSVQMVAEVDLQSMLDMQQDVENEKFKPTLLNSVMFLMTTLMAGVTFAVNYRGEPFMQSIRRNRPMFYALIMLTFIIFYFAFEVDPEVNEMFEIVTFPSAEFRMRFIALLASDALGCFVIEKACLMLFTDY